MKVNYVENPCLVAEKAQFGHFVNCSEDFEFGGEGRGKRRIKEGRTSRSFDGLLDRPTLRHEVLGRERGKDLFGGIWQGIRK